MLSAFSSICLLLFTSVLIVESNVIHTCQALVDKLDTCMAVVQFGGDCNSGIVNLTDTDYAKCNTTSFFWSYPLNNLTLMIETPFTHQHEPYSIYLDNEQLMSAVSHVYRIFNNQETDVTTKDKTLIQYSDSNYEIILKFQGPEYLHRYGVNIDYNVLPM
ncbi:unnamed protein product [Rotaria sp. Silwood2]|nr:unnamed protein product [Rotaria sp. Silwood2]CAF2669121.1 unnamed protein product [Rotaria sp. Silwood2]CAF2946219.1 unnamed protein product [Rotaria sp. Silwood2]CAF3322274.1 unnamed protein product [Rotaria sp. Silwood2]CAF4006755.1 unnamed protein product [Rotaria sp. Silwood2]